MSRYKQNKANAVTFNTAPTLTDQSQASTTDINIIMTQFMRTGAIPNAREPIYADFTQLPEDLRGFIERARSVEQLKATLPKELAAMSLEDLVALKPEQLKAILTPVEPTNEPKKEEPKT